MVQGANSSSPTPAHLAADRAADEQVLGPVDLRRLREHARSAVPDEFVHRPAQRGVRGDA
jgi:hypothetical protein